MDSGSRAQIFLFLLISLDLTPDTNQRTQFLHSLPPFRRSTHSLTPCETLSTSWSPVWRLPSTIYGGLTDPPMIGFYHLYHRDTRKEILHKNVGTQNFHFLKVTNGCQVEQRPYSNKEDFLCFFSTVLAIWLTGELFASCFPVLQPPYPHLAQSEQNILSSTLQVMPFAITRDSSFFITAAPPYGTISAPFYTIDCYQVWKASNPSSIAEWFAALIKSSRLSS